MQGFCPLASGSKGNCLYVGTSQTRLLIDIGISARAAEQRLAQIGVDPTTLSAILITHEHIDHIGGLTVFATRYNLPVFANTATARGIVTALQSKPRFKLFTTGESFSYGDLKILPFSIPHDTLDPVGFLLETPHYKLGVCTDLGHITAPLRTLLRHCNSLILESNHEPSMVHASRRPPIYKTRVLSKQGHLSNEQSSQFLLELHHPDLSHVHLAHLSQECNNPDLALKTARETLARAGKEVALSIAYQDRISTPIEGSLF